MSGWFSLIHTFLYTHTDFKLTGWHAHMFEHVQTCTVHQHALHFWVYIRLRAPLPPTLQPRNLLAWQLLRSTQQSKRWGKMRALYGVSPLMQDQSKCTVHVQQLPFVFGWTEWHIPSAGTRHAVWVQTALYEVVRITCEHLKPMIVV